MQLSILIPTVTNRSEVFSALYQHLSHQLVPGAEIISVTDSKEATIGAKRQRLLEIANGSYVTFIDDDDWVPHNYVENIMAALQQQPDCIGMKMDYILDGVPKTAVSSLRYPNWAENKDGYDYIRTIDHRNTVRRKLALQAQYHDMRYGEDRDYSMRLLKHLRKEVFIDEVMYFYHYSSAEAHHTKYGFHKDKTNR